MASGLVHVSRIVGEDHEGILLARLRGPVEQQPVHVPAVTPLKNMGVGAELALVPYQEALALAEHDGVDPEEFVAFAPDEHFDAYSYGSDLLSHDGAGDPWSLVDAVTDDPAKLGGPLTKLLTDGLRKGWTRLADERRALLQLLGRCAISEDQALRYYDTTARAQAGIAESDTELLRNPYLLFERDRRAAAPIAFGAADRGLFPDEAVREQFPVPEPSRVEDPADERRVRTLVVDLLEHAAAEGHTLLPRSWVIRRARERALQPPCPLGENVLDACEETFPPVVARAATRAGEPAYQVDRLIECRTLIRREVLGRKKGKPHTADLDWRGFVDAGLDVPLPRPPQERELEERARREKAGALDQLFRSRLCVLIGRAGTGKTTLLRMLCSLPGLAEKGLLLLAPTGKARVRLEDQTGMRGAGQTLAQFLIRQQRYDGETGAYFPKRSAPRCGDYRTVIVDECSMLTEEQLAALIDSLRNVERFVLVGDPCQLPPIGAGRPFVDIVRELEPENVETFFPRCGPGYAELTIPRRQKGEAGADMLLASYFSGRPLDPGADAVFDETEEVMDRRLRRVRWNHPQELQEKLVEALVEALGLAGPDVRASFPGTALLKHEHAFPDYASF